MKRIISLILCLMLCLGLWPAYAEDIAALTAAAEAGDLRAMDDLASAYYYGEGVAQDYNLAAYWWYKGAEAGDPSCMNWIGTMFYYGEGVEQNRQEALKWTKKAAQGGDPYAVFYMGYITARGTSGAEKSASRAREYFLQGTQCGAGPERALFYFDWEVPSAYCFDSVLAQANGGNPAAMCDVAYMYFNGTGTEKNDALAAYWWYAAADAGVTIAMYDVAYMFVNGLGTAQNVTEGKNWIQKFVANINKGKAGDYSRNYTENRPAPTAVPTPVPTAAPTKAPTAAPRASIEIDAGRPGEMMALLGLDALLEAAALGDLDAAYILGWCYWYGVGVDQNFEEAFAWFHTLAAEEDDPRAYIYAADAYYSGLGVEQDYGEALRWYMLAAQEGDGRAMAMLAQMYREGQGVRQDDTKAERWQDRAEEAGYSGLDEGYAELGDVDMDRGRPAEMMELLGLENLLEAAALGDLDAVYILGWCYHYGVGVGRDDAESFAWFLRLAEEGDPAAYIWVGDACFYGQGTAQDYSQALTWYLLAADERDGRAMYMLGQMYRNGLGVKQDDAKADKWYSRAEEAGYTQEMIEEQPEAEQDIPAWNAPIAAAPAKVPEDNRPSDLISLLDIDIDAGQPEMMMELLGLENLLDAAALGDLDAAYILGWCFWHGVGVAQDYAEAFAWFRTLAEDEGDPRAYIYVADAYYGGLGVEQNYAEAVRWYAAAAEEGDDDLMLQVGNYYYRGEIIEQDYAEALRWYLKAADEGNIIAMGNAADIYNYGRGSVAQDLPKAFALYKQSAELGNVSSMGNLGVCYLNGRGTSKNTSEAVRWITKAAESGNATAMYNLGQLYENGIGVKKSASTARSWYEKAAAAGNANAKKKLGQ